MQGYFKEYIMRSKDHKGSRDRDREKGYKEKEKSRSRSQNRERFTSSGEKPMKGVVEGSIMPLKGVIYMIEGEPTTRYSMRARKRYARNYRKQNHGEGF